MQQKAKKPRIEVISKRPARPNGLPPIVLVHGAWHGAWCWDMGFMDRLVAAGFECHALDLRGHGGSEGHGAMRRHRIAGYVDDLRGVVAGLDRPAVVVGHSMGGFVVQKYLETDRALGGVLLASVPPTGIFPMYCRLVAADPLGVAKALLTMRCKPVMDGVGRVAKRLFTPSTPAAVVRDCAARVQDESFTAFLELLLFVRVKPRSVRDPVMVIGTELDGVFPIHEVRATAEAYGTEAVVMPGMGHDAMLDNGWERVADLVAGWAASFGAQDLRIAA